MTTQAVSKNWKWIALFCSVCSAPTPPAVGTLDKPDSMISPYPCWECEHPEEVEAERQSWKEADRKIAEMIARGEIKDAQGNPVPNIRIIT